MRSKELERILKALANKRRLAILSYLKKVPEASVSEIAGEINLSLKAPPKHLTIMDVVDIIEKEQRSLQMYYSLSKEQTSAAKSILFLL